MSKEFIIGVLVDTLNKTEVEVASLYNEDGTVKPDAKQTILNWDAERVKELKSVTQKTAMDDGYKKAQSEILSKFENDFKTKTGFKSDKKGIELVLEFAASKKTEGEVTDDVIKKHPLYLSLQERLEAEKEAVKAEGETKLKQFQTEISKKEAFKTVEQKALELFHAQKPILAKDPIKAKAQEKLFIDQLKGFEYEIQGDRIVVLKDGKVHENSQGHAIAFDKLIKDTANSYFEFHITDPKSSPGNTTTTGNEGQSFEVPKDKETYAKIIADSTIPVEKRLAIKEAWQKANPVTS